MFQSKHTKLLHLDGRAVLTISSNKQRDQLAECAVVHVVVVSFQTYYNIVIHMDGHAVLTISSNKQREPLTKCAVIVVVFHARHHVIQ